MKALIVSNGCIIKYEKIRDIANKVDFILCADGGIRHLINADLIPHLIIGDLDSVDEMGLLYIKKNKIPVHKFPVEKNETDTELSAIYLMDKGYKDITFVGATGTRLDHTLANIFLLKKLYKNGINARIMDDNNTICYTDSRLVLSCEDVCYTSIVPLSASGADISLKGFYYPLNNQLIEFGTSLGISNRILDEFGIIEVIRGDCLVFTSKD